MGSSNKTSEVNRIWAQYGDHIATVPLGRDGLAALLDHSGEPRVDRGILDQVVKRAA